MQNITYLNVEDPGARSDAAAWARFTSAADEGELFAGWLAITVARIGRVRSALLLTLDADGKTYTVAAGWPGLEHDLRHLGPLAQQVLEQRSAVIAAPGASDPAAAVGAAQIGCPLDSAHALHGVVVVELEPRGGELGLQQALRELHWGSGWLIDHFRQLQMQQLDADFARAELLNGVLATAMQHPLRQTSALAVVNELTSRLGCDRVAAGFAAAGRVTPAVLSHTATFDIRSDLARWIGEAMDEVLDLGVGLVHPAPADDEFGALAHAETARRLAVEAMLSVPVRAESQTVGVLSFERSRGPAFTSREIELATALGAMLGPVWALQHSRERGTATRMFDASRDAVRGLFGPTHPGLKLLMATLALTVAGLAAWEIDYRVSGRTVVEGATQLAAVAPFDGFIAAGLCACRRQRAAGAGAGPARRPRSAARAKPAPGAEREQLLRRYQVAQAAADRGAMGVLGAQINQAEAQLSLAEEKLSRATRDRTVRRRRRLRRPEPADRLAGRDRQGAVRGRAAAAATASCCRSTTATSRAWRSARPASWCCPACPARSCRSPSGASRRSPRSATAATCSASRPSCTARHRPGCAPAWKGVGKVGVGERSLLWIWTHGFIDWLRLSVWNWLP